MAFSLKNRDLMLAAAVLSVAAAATVVLVRRKRRHDPLPVAPGVDIDRYLGTWYEIARLPTRFEKGCYGTRATYARRPDGTLDVLNTCHKGSPAGPLDVVRGKAWVTDTDTQAKLKVQFFWPFSGDYWILEVGRDYDYAVVGTPDRQNLWILSRTPDPDKALVSDLIHRAEEQGFTTLRLIFTKHPMPALAEAAPAG